MAASGFELIGEGDEARSPVNLTIYDNSHRINMD